MTGTMPIGAWNAGNTATILVGVLGFVGVCLTLWVQGLRAERNRLRELYAAGWAAVQAYKEFAFAVRRRDDATPGPERVRISSALSDVQRDLDYHDALISRNGLTRTAVEYRNLVLMTRQIAGEVIKESWNSDPITADTEMHAPEIAKRLKPLKPFEEGYLDAAADETSHWWGPKSQRSSAADRGEITERVDN